jgi:hypothetical protein
MASSDFDSTHVSEPYASTGLIEVLYNFTLFIMDRQPPYYFHLKTGDQMKLCRLACCVNAEASPKCATSGHFLLTSFLKRHGTCMHHV